MSRLTIGALVAVAAVVLVVLSAFPLAAQNASVQFEKNDCPFDHPNNPTVICGTLIVPEDRAKPEGNQVYLAVAVYPARDPHPAPDPLFFLDGGPGASTLQNWGGDLSFPFADMNRTRDVVLMDYRGAGYSEPSLYCDEVADYYSSALDSQDTDSQAAPNYLTALKDCRARLVDDEGVD